LEAVWGSARERKKLREEEMEIWKELFEKEILGCWKWMMELNFWRFGRRKVERDSFLNVKFRVNQGN
jgi:DNA topoisomerase VI subunit A